MILLKLRRFGWLMIFLAAQVFVFGHIHLFGLGTPMVHILFCALLQRGTGRAEAILWGFAMGMAVDFFMLTPGLTAAAMTAVGLVQPYLFERMLDKEALEDCTPGFDTLGTWCFIQYITILVLLHNVTYFALEACTLAHFTDSILRMAISTLLTIAIIIPTRKLI